MERELGTKAERVGNFRLFRTYAPCGAKQRVDAVKVTNLEGSWGVVIPYGWGMYNVIIELFRSGKDEDANVLHNIFCNWYAVTSIADGDFHMDVIDAQKKYVWRMTPPDEADEEDMERMAMAEEAKAILEEEE